MRLKKTQFCLCFFVKTIQKSRKTVFWCFKIAPKINLIEINYIINFWKYLKIRLQSRTSWIRPWVKKNSSSDKMGMFPILEIRYLLLLSWVSDASLWTRILNLAPISGGIVLIFWDEDNQQEHCHQRTVEVNRSKQQFLKIKIKFK